MSKKTPAKPGVFHMRAKPYVTGNTQVCVKQLTLAYEQPHKTKAPLPKGGCPSECEDWGIFIKRRYFDDPSVVCFANTTSLCTREAMKREKRYRILRHNRRFSLTRKLPTTARVVGSDKGLR